MSIQAEVARRFEYWLSEGKRLAGDLCDVPQRAATYLQIYLDSHGSHIFPLIAAHGACWSKAYFAWGTRIGWWLSLPYMLRRNWRAQRLQMLSEFTNAFRDINRRVCIDTYANFHLSREFRNEPSMENFIRAPLLHVLRKMHDFADRGQPMSNEGKYQLFHVHFLNEQNEVVAPAIAKAVEGLRWPLLKRFALSPRIRFAYFTKAQSLVFKNFADTNERIERGKAAYYWAQETGWDLVVDRLGDYGVLVKEPAAFSTYSAPNRPYDSGDSQLLSGLGVKAG